MRHNKVLVFIIALCFAIAPLSSAFAADGAHITIDWTKVPSSTISLETGQLYTLALDEIFSDPNSDHTLTYSVTGANIGPQTHIAYPVKSINNTNIIVPTLVFTVANTGTYNVTVRATCSSEDYAEFDISFAVTLASDGTPSQYSYDETAKSSVRVYVTISNDGMPIKGANGTVMANLPVDVPYFDLGLDGYNLDDYYRYPTNGGSGEYISSNPSDVIQRPTALHLYIYLMERYYMGLSESYWANGTSGVLSYDSPESIYYMDGTLAYNSGTGNALSISGSATSLYLTSFWGHDCNLMYFRNHVFPLMSPGWGATCDYALLSDGDVIEIAMFSDWGFYSDGAFLRYDGYDKLASCNIECEDTLTVSVQKYNTVSMGNGSFINTTIGLSVAIYSSNGILIDSFTWDNNNSGNEYSYEIEQGMDGIYYVVAMDPSAKSSYACMAPAVMTVDVY